MGRPKGSNSRKTRARIMRAREGGEIGSETWPADQVERWPLSKLIPYACNARTHSDEQVAQIAASIREWGWTVPVLVDEQGTLIAGHGRVLAAQQLGITDVPTMVARGWTPAQIQAYRLTDNQLALNAGWDRELLGLELGELKLGGFDLALTGFGELELGDLLADRTAGLTDPDDAPEAPEHPVSRTGDLWLLRRQAAINRRRSRDWNFSARALPRHYCRVLSIRVGRH
jgi:ParB-like chromosome segregation protein Spo0J